MQDIIVALYNEGKHNVFHSDLTQHKNQHGQYVELRNVVFKCDKDQMVNAPEYDDVANGQWYVENYEPRIMAQVPLAVNNLINDNTSRRGVFTFFNEDDVSGKEPPCTMYVALRLDKMAGKAYSLSYTVHMRSSDIVEMTSDLRFHRRLRHVIACELQNKMHPVQIVESPIIWCADSLQCYEGAWQSLKEAYDSLGEIHYVDEIH